MREIVAYLAEHLGKETALRIEDKPSRSSSRWPRTPRPGTSTIGLDSTSTRLFTVDPFLIVYQREVSPIVIHAVFNGARDVKRELKQRSA